MADKRAWEELARRTDVVSLGLGSADSAVAHWKAHGYGPFALFWRDTSEFCGVAGLAKPWRCDGPHLLAAMLPAWRGIVEGRRESLTFEACREVLAWWFGLGRGEPFAHVEPRNKKGRHLAEALGGIRVAPRQGYFRETMADYIFRRPASSPTGSF
jgi:hypothetical protein